MVELPISEVVQQRKLRLEEELIYALQRTSSSDLSEWGKQTAKRFAAVGAKRVTGFGSLLATITTLSADALVKAMSALSESTFRDYANDRATRAKRLATQVMDRGQAAFDAAASTFKSRPSEGATHVLSLVVGFYCGSGGNGDGGIPDLDLLAGIGAHRSILTHSIVAGVFVETAVVSLIDLVQIVHAHLPPVHSEFWDAMLKHADIGGSNFVSGASMGIATHLGIDTLIDGFTPYKDLPIELPRFAHEALMGLNAGMEGVYGARRYGQGLWDGNVVPPEGVQSQEAPASVLSGAVAIPLQQLAHQGRAVSNATINPGSMGIDNQFTSVVELCDRVHRALGVDTKEIDEAIESIKNRVDQASGAFRLGVVGEFRVGKSTLINALLGREIAFTDFMEATPVICSFVKTDEIGASIVWKTDGRIDSMSISECNAILDQRRHDKDWSAQVLKVEYHVPSNALDGFTLWDAPGLGGSDNNDELAQRYIDTLSGAIWVMDATLVGKAAIANPLARMHADRKPIICVLNRIDETNEDPETLKNWVAQAYPEVFEEIVVFSAQAAIDSAEGETPSPASRELWEIIKRAIGVDEEESSANRASVVAANAKALLATKLEALSREIQDRIGAVCHFELGLREAKQRAMETVGAHLSQRTESIFAGLKSRLQSEIQRDNWSPDSIDKVISLLKDKTVLSELSEKVARESVHLVNQSWLKVSEHALRISAAAIPLEKVTTVSSNGGLNKSKDEKAIEHGVYVGGMTAIGTGTIAAISTIVSWPVILAAVPVGALAMWKKRRDMRASEAELMIEVDRLLSGMKHAFVQQARPAIESGVASAIQAQIDQFLEAKRMNLLGGAEIAQATEFAHEVRSMERLLRGPACLPPKTDWSGQEVLALLENPGARLDIVTQRLDFTLSPLLTELPAKIEIRLVLNASNLSRREVEDLTSEAFENWPGKKRIKAVAELGDVVLPTMLLTQDRCFVSNRSLGQILEHEMCFHEFDGGRIAAEQLFAGLWEGSPYMGKEIEVFPVH